MSETFEAFKKVHLNYLIKEFPAMPELDEKYFEQHAHGVRTPSGNIYLIAPKPVLNFFDASRVYKVMPDKSFLPIEIGFTAACQT